jgi:hypothetical protein
VEHARGRYHVPSRPTTLFGAHLGRRWPANRAPRDDGTLIGSAA